jgi:subtilisin-like proprotein convertase family protein
MKRPFIIGLLALGALLPVHAGIYSAGNVNGNGTALNLGIPDGTPIGVASTINVSRAGSMLSAVTVTLNVAGGYNGGLYAYLSYNGMAVTLLNQVGTGTGNAIQQTFGFSTSGFNNVTLSDTGNGGDIHDVATPGSLPAVSYTPDGGSLATFNGADPNGMWTLYFADLTAGSTSTLEGWSLDITTVPEPVNVALAIFGGLLAIRRLRRWRCDPAPVTSSN